MAEEPSRKRIAKNAVMLTLRLILSTAISLYTSRIVLEVLGESDFGIYGLVGGVVAVMSILNTSMAGATSRFITYEMGKGNTRNLRKIFATTFWIHAAIAGIVFLGAETIGLWFVNSKLNIPEESMYAANWVYQFSIISTMLSITQVPYTSCIMAHEKMGVYAYIELLNTVLRLVIVYFLVITPGDKLIIYGLLQMGVSLLLLEISRVYCIRKFTEARIGQRPDFKLARPMFAFTGWNLLITACVSGRHQGIAFITNIFFGVLLNTACFLASTVSGVVGGLFSNVTVAFRPQIVKQYAAGNIGLSQELVEHCFIFSSMVCGIAFIPIYLDIGFVLSVWLVKVPDYVGIFIILSVLAMFVDLFNHAISGLIQATGHIRTQSLCTGFIYLLQLPVIWVLFRIFHNPTISYIVSIVIMGIVVGFNLIVLKRLIPEMRMRAMTFRILRCSIAFALSTAIVVGVIRILGLREGWLSLFSSGILGCIAIVATYSLLVFDKSTRVVFRQKLRNICSYFIPGKSQS